MDAHLGYVIYPAAQKQLSVLSDAQSEMRSLDYADVFSPFRYSDWSSFRRDLLQSLGGLGEQEREFFIGSLADVREKRLPWRVLRGSGINEIPSNAEDILMLGGFYAGRVLSAEDLAGFMRLGFFSFPQFAGTFGAYLKSVLSTGWKGYGYKGYSWQSEHPDGRVFRNQLTTNEHADFWIVQTEVTPMLTLNPLGQQVEYRPLTGDDEHCVISVRGAEASFLASVLRFAAQVGADLPVLDDTAFNEMIASKSSEEGTLHAPNSGLVSLFGAEVPLVCVRSSSKHTIKSYWCDAFCYELHEGSDSELLVMRSRRGNLEPSPLAKFIPSDLDHIVRGILANAASGIGLSSVRDVYGVYQLAR